MHEIKLWLAGCVIVSALMTPVGAGAEENGVPMSLKDCIDRALKENLNFQSSALGLRLDDLSIVQAQSQFDPSLSVSMDRRQSESPTFYQYYGVGSISSKTTELNMTLGQKLSTGGNWGFGFYNTLSESNIETSKNYTSVFGLSLSQPLLKGFGKKNATSQIYLARLAKESTALDLESQAVELVDQVQSAYWNLVYARQTLLVRELSVAQAESLLVYNIKGQELGVLTESDVLEAKSMVFSRRQSVLDQMNAIRTSEDVLRQLLHMTSADDWKMSIDPSDSPVMENISVITDTALAEALDNRLEYRTAKKRHERIEFNRDLTKNNLLPDLDLSASYNVNGSGKTYAKNFGEINDFDKYGWNVGLTFSYPLKNRSAEAEYEKRTVEIRRSDLELKQLESRIDTEIRAAIRNVEIMKERADVAKMSVEVDELKLKKEEERFRNKMSSSYYVLQYQNDLANSRNAYNRTVIDYINAVNELKKARGIVLSAQNITVIGFEN